MEVQNDLVHKVVIPIHEYIVQLPLIIVLFSDKVPIAGSNGIYIGEACISCRRCWRNYTCKTVSAQQRTVSVHWHGFCVVARTRVGGVSDILLCIYIYIQEYIVHIYQRRYGPIELAVPYPRYLKSFIVGRSVFLFSISCLVGLPTVTC